MRRKMALVALLLCVMLLLSGTALAEHSREYREATDLFINGEYEKAYALFMEIDSGEDPETFDTWVDRFLFECDSNKYNLAVSERAWQKAAGYLVDMGKRCYSQSGISMNALLERLIDIGEHFYPEYGCETFLNDMRTFLIRAEDYFNNEENYSSFIRSAFKKLSFLGEERLNSGDYPSAKKIYIFISYVEANVGVMIEDLNARTYAAAALLLADGKEAEAAAAFEALGEYRDSAERAKNIRAGIAYAEADALLAEGKQAEAADAFEKCGEYKDAKERAFSIRGEIAYLQAEAFLEEGKKIEAARSFEKCGEYLDAPYRAAQLWNEIGYAMAESYLSEGKNEEAAELFELLDTYSDSADRAEQLRNMIAYNAAENLLTEGKREEAASAFEALGTYKDSATRVYQIRYEMPYADAEALLAQGKREEAAAAFEALGDYSDAASRVTEIRFGMSYADAEALLADGKREEAAAAFAALGDYADAKERVQQILYGMPYAEAEALLADGKKTEAAAAFEALGNYRDSKARAIKIRYDITYKKAETLLSEGKREEAARLFESLGNYSDAANRAAELRRELLYELAVTKLNNREYEEAAQYFDSLGNYRDAEKLAQSARSTGATLDDFRYSADYNRAVELFDAEAYDEALALFITFNGFRDSVTYINRIYYMRAETLLEAGKLKEARAAFAALGDFKDAQAMVAYINKAMENPFIGAKVGDFVKFGRYEQDNDTSNGTEPIEWQVLAVESGRVLAISRYALDCKPYHQAGWGVTWETSSLRKWLNDEFYQTAFNTEERAAIAITKVTTDKNPKYSIDPGNDTEDKVWLLSIPEAEKYFADAEARVCYPTQYAKANGAYTNNNIATCWWWLRSPGRISSSTSDVRSDGIVSASGIYVSYDEGCVRPVIALRLA